MAIDQSWIANLLGGVKQILANGVLLPKRSNLNFVSATVQDNPNYVDPSSGQVVGRTDVTISGTVSPFLLTNLRTATANGSGHDVKFVEGYANQGDGGQGTFVWNSTDTRTDDSGTIIQVTGVPTGRWNRAEKGPLNVRWFGATGNGATDDTGAILAAIASANAGGIYFPPGTYALFSNLALSVASKFDIGAKLSPNSGKVVTVSAPIDNTPANQIFTGAGTVVFNAGSTQFVFPDWWGPVNTGVGNLPAAVLAVGASGVEILLRSATYDLGGGSSPGLVILNHDVTIRGICQTVFGVTGGATIIYSGTSDAVVVGNTLGTSYLYRFRFEDAGINAGGNSTSGLRLWYQTFAHVNRCWVKGDGLAVQNLVLDQIGINNHYEKLFTQGNTSRAGGSPQYGDRAVGVRISGSTTIRLHGCYHQYASVCNYYDTCEVTALEPIFETSARSFLATNSSIVAIYEPHIENCGDDSASFESGGHVDGSLTTVDMYSPTIVMYPGQATVFQVASSGGNQPTLNVWGGRVAAGWTGVVSAATAASPIVCTSNAHLLQTNDTIAFPPGNYGMSGLTTTLAGTVSVTNGQAGITFSSAQTLPAGTQVQFASQLGTLYTILNPVIAGTAATLTANYTGTTAGATTTTIGQRFVVTVTGANTFSLNGSTGSGSYTASTATFTAEARLFYGSTETATMRCETNHFRLQGPAQTAGLWSVQPNYLRNTQTENPNWYSAKPMQLKVVAYRFQFKNCVTTIASSNMLTESGSIATAYRMPEAGYILSQNFYYSSTMSGGSVAANVQLNGSNVIVSGAVTNTIMNAQGGSQQIDHAYLSNPFAAGDILTVVGSANTLTPTGGDLICEVLVGFGDGVN